MEILGINVLQLIITDPFGNRNKLTIFNEDEYLKQIIKMDCEIEDLLRDELKFKSDNERGKQ